MKRRPPPLRALLVAAGAALLPMAAVSASYSRYYADTESHYLEYDRGRLAALRERAGGGGAAAPRVVGVGTSLLGSATFYDGQMEEFARQAGMPVGYVRMARPGGGPRDRLAVMRDVQGARPDVVLVDAGFMFSEIEPLAWHWQGMRSHLLRLRAQRGREFWGRERQDVLRLMMRDELRAPTRHRQEAIRRREEVAEGVRMRLRRFGLAEGWTDLLRGLRDDGAQVLVLNLPIHESEAAGRDPQRVATMAAALRDMEAAGLVKVLDCPLRFRHADFADGWHMAQPAREKYCRWLLAELARLRAR